MSQDDAAQPFVGIVILNWNGWRDTLECLDSVERLTYPAFDVVVVDNGSTDESIERIHGWALARGAAGPRALSPTEGAGMGSGFQYLLRMRDQESARGSARRLALIALTENRGFSAGHNVGIRYVLRQGAQHVFVLNNDAVVEPEALAHLVAAAAEDAGVGMVAPAVYRYFDREQVDRLGLVMTKAGLVYDRRSPDDGPFLCPSGCAALYSRAMLDAVVDHGEYFDEEFFAHCEDADLGIRAIARGFTGVLAARSCVFHKIGGSTGGPGSATTVYLRNRNTIWMIAKNFPTGLLLRYGLWMLGGQAAGMVRNFVGSHTAAVLRGKWDGFKGVGRMWRKGRMGARRAAYRLPMDGRLYRSRPSHRLTTNGAEPRTAS